MTVDPRTKVADGAHITSLWIGLLVPPTAFLLNLELAYALVPEACAATNVLIVHLVHAVCLLLAIAGGVVAWLTWKTVGAQWPGEEGGRVARSRFMAGGGVLGSGLFALVILAQWIPTFILSPCQ